MKKSLFVVATMLLLNACQIHTVKLGDPNIYYTPTAPENIAVYYQTMPTCNYKEIALLDNPLSKWSDDLQSSVDQIKEVAAEQGADFIVINGYEKNRDNQKRIDSVVAYKCVK